MPRAVVWVCRSQAVGLAGLAVALLVLRATSDAALSAVFLVLDVVAALAGAALLTFAARRRRARTPILLVELIAVGISTQLWGSGQHGVAVIVGLPALTAVLLILRAVGSTSR